jgi:hypothetical protein
METTVFADPSFSGMLDVPFSQEAVRVLHRQGEESGETLVQLLFNWGKQIAATKEPPRILIPSSSLTYRGVPLTHESMQRLQELYSDWCGEVSQAEIARAILEPLLLSEPPPS